MNNDNNNNTMYNILKVQAVRDIVSKRKVVTVSVSNSISYAMNLFARYEILSCPVLQDSDSRIPIGWIDVFIILQYLMGRVSKPVDQITNEDLIKLSVENIKVADVMLQMKTEPFITVYDSVNVHMLLELFALGSHRAALYSLEPQQPHGEFHMQEVLSYVCSQSDLIRFIASKIDDEKMEVVATSNLLRLGFHERAVVRINGKSNVLNALWECANHRVSHLAIVDDNDVVIGTFSASSLRSLTPETFEHLTLPLIDYLKQHGQKSLEVHSVAKEATLKALVHTFTNAHTHHVYVLNDDGSPSCIITLTDALNAILKFRISSEERKDIQSTLSALKVPGKLTITVHSARALPSSALLGGTVDSYVIVKLPGGGVIQSDIFRKTDAPSFDFVNEYEVTHDVRHNRIAIELWDYRRFMPAKFIGVVTFNMEWILNGFGTKAHVAYMREWYPLIGGDPQQGEVDITLLYEEH